MRIKRTGKRHTIDATSDRPKRIGSHHGKGRGWAKGMKLAPPKQPTAPPPIQHASSRILDSIMQYFHDNK